MKRSTIRTLAAAVAAAALVAGILAGCSDEKRGDLKQVQRTGRLVVGTSADYPPYAMLDLAGKAAGLDVDLAREVARELGVRLEVRDLPLDQLLAAVAERELDMAAAGLRITPGRREQVDFSRPYLTAGIAIVVQADTGNGEAAGSLEDLAGRRVAVQAGTEGERLARGIPEAAVQAYPLAGAAAAAVANRLADALLVHSAVAQALAQEMPLQVAAVLDPAEAALALPPGSDELRAAVDAALDRMAADGRLQQLVDRWFAPGQ